MRKRVPLRMDETIIEQIDIVANATGTNRTQIIEKFCLAGLSGIEKILNKRKETEKESISLPD